MTPSPRQFHGPVTNAGQAERAAWLVLGGSLLVLGLAGRSVGGAAAAMAGGSLPYRGITGHSRFIMHST